MKLVVAPTIRPHTFSTTWWKQQNFDHVIIKCNNKNACGSKITVRAGDRKQEIYNWWPYRLKMISARAQKSLVRFTALTRSRTSAWCWVLIEIHKSNCGTGAYHL